MKYTRKNMQASRGRFEAGKSFSTIKMLLPPSHKLDPSGNRVKLCF